MLKKDGMTFWANLEVTVAEDAGGAPLCRIVIIDITKRKKAEMEKNKIEYMLRQSQKMEAIGQLTGGISHDFSNLLSVINGYSQILLTNSDLSDSIKHQVEEINQASERAANLVRQLLLFSRRNPVDFKIICLDLIISGVEKMLRRLIRANIVINRKTGPAPWKINADLCSIEQVIMNLVINASDAMPDGGILTIETENVEIDETDCINNHPDIKTGRYVKFSVSDTGCGMDEKVMEHIFEPFFTTKEAGKGTGLGLATVFNIIKQSNAHIDVQSEPGKGARFLIYFPQVAGDADKEKKGVEIMPGGTETILLAEDENSLLEMIMCLLQSLGYAVLPAGNGKEALEIIANHKGQIHLLLTDIVMPGMNGFELAGHMKDLWPEVKTLFMSGYAEPTGTRKMMKTSDNFIQKPIYQYTLAVKIREILDK
jgi:signal transduction histidine kinase